jgi:ribonucleoside-triphosphate reductase
MVKALIDKRTRCEVYSRIVGYLRPVGQWNKGKQAEFSIRRTFKAKI